SGLWEGFIPGALEGHRYKYHITSNYHGHQAEKADPFAFYNEPPPGNASIIRRLGFPWADGEWMRRRRSHNHLEAPLAIYEVHLGSWARVPEEGNRPLRYRELAPRLAAHVRHLGFTH